MDLPADFRSASRRLRRRTLLAALLAALPPLLAGSLAGFAAARALDAPPALFVLPLAGIALLLDGGRVPLRPRLLDRRLALAGRLVTAREVARGDSPHAAESLLLRDAARWFSRSRASDLLPAGAGPATRTLFLAAAALLALELRPPEGKRGSVEAPRSGGATGVPAAAEVPGAGEMRSEAIVGRREERTLRREETEPGSAPGSAEESRPSDATRMPRLVPIEPGKGPTARKESLVFEFPDAVASGEEVVRRVSVEEGIEEAAEKASAWTRRARIVPAEVEFVGAYFEALRP